MFKRQFLVIFFIFIGGIFLFEKTSIETKAVEFLPTSVEVVVSCGDGLAESVSGEFCDPGEPPLVPPDVGTTTCRDFDDVFGDAFVSGSLTCKSDCSYYDLDVCYTCGNGYREEAEKCDGSSFGDRTCISYGFSGGSLVCTSDCQVSTINCVAMNNEGVLPGGGGGGGGSGSGGGAGTTYGYLPGSNEEIETKVVMRGKSYPHSDVHILVDGKVVGIVETDAKADFYFETTSIASGVSSFGFWSEDPDGLKSTLLTLTFRVISGAVTTISGVYISPTIDIDKNSVKQGEDVRIYGKTVPDTEVHIHIHSDEEFVEQINSQEAGGWELTFNTEPLEEDFHIAKALFQVNADGNVIQSGFSKSVSFYVGKVGGEAACPEADLNKDGRVNLIDFSILLYNWGTDNACSDQNQNGTVDLIDFSIMMYYWTG